MNPLKILVLGDLHGAKVNLHFKEFDAIILPGDICGDSVKKFHFFSLKEKLEEKKQKPWYEFCGKEEAKKLVLQDLQKGRETLEFLNSLGKPIFTNPGNWEYTNEEKDFPWDTSYFNHKWKFLNKNYFKELIKGLPHIIPLHFEKHTFQGLDIIGYGVNAGTEYVEALHKGKEFEQERKKYYQTSLNKLSKLCKESKNPILFVTHNVPYNTKLDEIRNKESPRNGEHLGSNVAREITLTYKPIITIGSHIHENFGQDILGSIPLINTGFEGDCNTLSIIKNGKIDSIDFAGQTPEFP